jgi:excisionase family DNA binding protein
MKRLLTVEQVAEILQLHPRTVGKMAQARRLPVVRLGEGGRGRAVRIPEDALDEWIKQRTETPTSRALESLQGMRAIR